jgi:hypothetical protein
MCIRDRDNSPHHIQGDVLALLEQEWDMLIAHPPCTYLTCTGNKWFLPEYKERFPDREKQRENAKEFFMKFVNAPIDKICIENPIGIMNTQYQKPTQIIQPYQFGHPVSKATCLWLKGLPKLQPTEIVEPEWVVFKSGKRMDKWYCDAAKLPPEQREKLRSKTFEGVARAMANQWLI